jgi:hypothetical protein
VKILPAGFEPRRSRHSQPLVPSPYGPLASPRRPFVTVTSQPATSAPKEFCSSTVMRSASPGMDRLVECRFQRLASTSAPARAIDKVVLLACGRWASSPKARAYRALQRLRQFLRPWVGREAFGCGVFRRFGLDFVNGPGPRLRWSSAWLTPTVCARRVMVLLVLRSHRHESLCPSPSGSLTSRRNDL